MMMEIVSGIPKDFKRGCCGLHQMCEVGRMTRVLIPMAINSPLYFLISFLKTNRHDHENDDPSAFLILLKFPNSKRVRACGKRYNNRRNVSLILSKKEMGIIIIILFG
jgi:hypothetical protein